MPPKTAQKRAREPPAGANPPNVAAASAPLLLRRTRSNSNASNTSDARDNDEDGAPRSKRSRVDKTAGRLSEASDASMGEEEEDDDGGKGANGSRRMPSAKRATGRRKSTAVAVGGGIAQVCGSMVAVPYAYAAMAVLFAIESASCVVGSSNKHPRVFNPPRGTRTLCLIKSVTYIFNVTIIQTYSQYNNNSGTSRVMLRQLAVTTYSRATSFAVICGSPALYR